MIFGRELKHFRGCLSAGKSLSPLFSRFLSHLYPPIPYPKKAHSEKSPKKNKRWTTRARPKRSQPRSPFRDAQNDWKANWCLFRKAFRQQKLNSESFLGPDVGDVGPDPPGTQKNTPRLGRRCWKRCSWNILKPWFSHPLNPNLVVSVDVSVATKSGEVSKCHRVDSLDRLKKFWLSKVSGHKWGHIWVSFIAQSIVLSLQ